jgi:hypothetical protein
MMRTTLTIFGIASLGLMACRPDPGDPDYPDYTPYVDTDGGGGLPGDDPWDGTTPRLSFGAFYEGGSSDQLLVDEQSVFYFIYQGYSQTTSSERVEGFVSDELTLTGSSWWGGGIQLGEGASTDLSSWKTMHIALRSDDPEMEAFQLGMAGAGGEVRVSPSTYGFASDDEWHVLNIPMSAFAGAGLDRTNVMLLIISESGAPGTSVFIDDFYLVGE